MSRGPYPILLVLAMSLPGAARALGLGDIRIDSALNEPLSAQIDIVGATRDELIALTAKVANREIFQQYGADRPSFLSSATFKVGLDARGHPVLNVRSVEPFTDPVVNFLVDLRWDNGELIREYSLLLDPAEFAASRRLAAAPQSAPPSSSSSAGSSDRPEPASVATESPTVARQNGIPAAAAEAIGSHASQHRVAARDTLRAIVRRAGAATEPQAQRMMIAMFRANPHAFDGNINLLRLGAVITMPSAAVLAAIDPTDAKREVRTQMSAWRLAGRPAAAKLLAAAPAPQPAAPRPAAPRPAAPFPAAASLAALPDHPASSAPFPANANEQALAGRVQSLERALNDMHRQLEEQRAKPPATSAPGPGVPATAAATIAPPHADTHPAQILAAVAPPNSQGWSGTAIIAPLAVALSLLLAGIAYSRRRVARALAPTVAPTEGGYREQPPVAARDMTERPAAARSVPTPQVAERPPVVALAALAAPVLAAPIMAAPVLAKPAKHGPAAAAGSADPVLSEDTTQDLAIDTEALERSYLDALAIDSLGIDGAMNSSASPAPVDEDTATHEAVGLDTVAMDASELELAFDSDAGDTANARPRQLSSMTSTGRSTDHSVHNLEATVEHTQAHHVQMPSQLTDNAVVLERRMNIVDVLQKAIDRDPNRRDLRMKLLETYYGTASINRRAFLDIVKKMSRERESLTAEDWKKVAIMGKEIAPDDILSADAAKDDIAHSVG